MGGMATQRVDALLREALQASGRRCLVGAGWAGLGGTALPAHWRVVSAAPHALLFARVAAVVHHGGAGTTAQALRAGAPQVVLPLILDQYHHAHRLWRAGLIPKPVAMERITTQQLSASITAALAWPTAPLQVVARRLQHSDGRGQTAKHIEALLAPGKSGFRADTL
jgi:UDP:flavonoid glycosyltransferase YjiC (YdhE family)